jgi:hypothetical protein
VAQARCTGQSHGPAYVRAERHATRNAARSCHPSPFERGHAPVG